MKKLFMALLCSLSLCATHDDSDLYRIYDKAIFANTEFLFWTAQENTLDYAIKMKRPAWGPTPSLAQGNYESASLGFDPGFRVSIGYFNAPDYWELMAQFTWIYVSGHDTIRAPTRNNTFLNGTFPQFIPTLEKATSHIGLHYTVYDLLIDRVFHPNPHLRLKLFGGLVGTWMKQNWLVTYIAGDDNTRIQNKWHYWGLGVRTGFSFDWFIGHDFYLTGRASPALLVGRYHNRSRLKTSINPSGLDNTDIPVQDALYRDTRPTFAIQMLLGPSYQRNFLKSRFELFAGYELNTWLNLIETFRSTANSANLSKITNTTDGLLLLHGLTTRLTIDF